MHIGQWEFERGSEGQLLYRLSAKTTLIGWIIGLVIVFFLFVSAYASFTQKSFGWTIGLTIAGIAMIVLLIKNQMLRARGCVLDRRLDQFRTESATLCSLSEIEQVSCEWHRKPRGADDFSTRGAYTVFFLLRSGRKVYTYLGEQGEIVSRQQAQILSDFLALSIPERATVSRMAGV